MLAHAEISIKLEESGVLSTTAMKKLSEKHKLIQEQSRVIVYQEKSLARVTRNYIGKSYHTLYVIHINIVRILNTRYGYVMRLSYVNYVEVQSNKKSLI